MKREAHEHLIPDDVIKECLDELVATLWKEAKAARLPGSTAAVVRESRRHEHANSIIPRAKNNPVLPKGEGRSK